MSTAKKRLLSELQHRLDRERVLFGKPFESAGQESSS